MKLRFTKMQGAGNDFVVLDATQVPLALSAEQLRRLGNRRFGVGADQILVVEGATAAGADFRYRIFNGATGGEVEHCGNGARCFMRFVRDHGLSEARVLHVETVNRRLELQLQPDGGVRVDMEAPVFELPRVPFQPAGARPRKRNGFELWPLNLNGTTVELAVLSMGNPHAVQLVDDVDTAPLAAQGPLIERHAAFPQRVNAGFVQVVGRGHVRLRVFERGAGETLSCGTGACAAVVAGIRLGLLDSRVEVDTRGGRLVVEWDGGGRDGSRPGSRMDQPVFMSGPAETVFEGEIQL